MKQKIKIMNKYVIIVMILSFIPCLYVNGQKTYVADMKETSIAWLGEKVTGEHNGNILLKSGTLTMNEKKIISAGFDIDMTTITNIDLEDAGWNKKLVDHLKSEDFFGVDTYPTASLRITNQPDFSKGTAIVKGDLTIKGITNPIEFRASMQKVEKGIRFYANIVVDRSKYNVRYGSGSFFDNLGDKTIYDEFKLKINMLVKLK